jgi:hypothetical protein
VSLAKPLGNTVISLADAVTLPLERPSCLRSVVAYVVVPSRFVVLTVIADALVAKVTFMGSRLRPASANAVSIWV